MQLMTFTEMHVKWSVTLVDRLGPEILTVLEIKGQVLHAFSRFQFDSFILDILQRICIGNSSKQPIWELKFKVKRNGKITRSMV